MLFTAPPLVSRALRAAGRTPARRWWRSPARRSRTSAATEAGRRVPFRRLGDFGGVAPGVAVSSAVALCETPAADAKRHAECARAWRATARTTRAPPPTGTASRWRTPPSRSAGTARRGRPKRIRTRESCSASGRRRRRRRAARDGPRRSGARDEVLVRSCGGRSAARLRKRRGAPLRAPAGAGRKTVALVASSAGAGRASGGVSVRRGGGFVFLGGTPPSGRPASRAGVSVTNDPERFAASLFVGEDGRYGARLEMAASGDAATFVSRAKNKTAVRAGGAPPRLSSRARSSRSETRGFFFRLFRKRKRVPDDIHERCITTSGPVVFADARETRVRLRRRRPAPDGADAAPPPNPSPPCWFPRRKRRRASRGPRRRARPRGRGRARLARGRAPAPARRRRVVARDERRVRLGERRRRRARSTRSTSRRTKTTFNEKNASAPRGSSPRRWSRARSQTCSSRATTLSSQSLRTLRRRTCGCARRSPRSASRVSKTKTKTKTRAAGARRAARLCRRRRATRSPRRRRRGGGVACAVRELRDTPRDPSWVACAFGAVAPVAMRAEAAALAGENAGVCASPARAPRKPREETETNRSRFLPETEGFSFASRTPTSTRRFEPEASDNAAEVVSMASARLWTPLARGAPLGGAEVRVAGVRAAAGAAAAPRDASCAFGTARDFPDENRDGRGFRFVRVRVAARRARRLRDAPGRSRGFAVTDDVRDASRARHPLVTGRGFALLAYAAPAPSPPRRARRRIAAGRWRSSPG